MWVCQSNLKSLKSTLGDQWSFRPWIGLYPSMTVLVRRKMQFWGILIVLYHIASPLRLIKRDQYPIGFTNSFDCFCSNTKPNLLDIGVYMEGHVSTWIWKIHKENGMGKAHSVMSAANFSSHKNAKRGCWSSQRSLFNPADTLAKFGANCCKKLQGPRNDLGSVNDENGTRSMVAIVVFDADPYGFGEILWSK